PKRGGTLHMSTIAPHTSQPSPAPSTTPTTSSGLPWHSLGAVGLGYLLVSWGLGPISSILPTLATDLNPRPAADAAASPQALTAAGWVMNGYFLLLVSSVLIVGRLGDLLGHRRLFTLGIAIFGLGALASAVSPGLLALIAARGLQGVGAAMVYGTSLALVA